MFLYQQGQKGHPGPSGLPGEPVSALWLECNVCNIEFLCDCPHLVAISCNVAHFWPILLLYSKCNCKHLECNLRWFENSYSKQLRCIITPIKKLKKHSTTVV